MTRRLLLWGLGVVLFGVGAWVAAYHSAAFEGAGGYRDARGCHVPSTSLVEHVWAWVPFGLGVGAVVCGVLSVRAGWGRWGWVAAIGAVTLIAAYPVLSPVFFYGSLPEAWCEV